MISFPLLRRSLRAGWKTFALFQCILFLYITVIVMMFDPDVGRLLEELTASLGDMMSLFGMGQAGATLVDFMSNYLYGFLMLVFPMAYAILTANRLIARQVDQRSMAFLLASPVSRARVALTQSAALIAGLLAMDLLCCLAGLAAAGAFFPGELDIAAFSRLHGGVSCLHLCIGGFCFLASCLFNETRHALALGAGVPVVCYLLQMLVNMGEKLAFLRFFTPFTLFDQAGLIAGQTDAAIKAIVLLSAGIALFASAVRLFQKRDLPL